VRVYTVGYEGRDVQAFVELLFAVGIDVLADVRDLPLSRKRGFSKGPLREAAEAFGIRYVHLKELGAPADIRHALKAGGPWEDYQRGYRLHLETVEDAVAGLANLARSARVAMMCYERDPRRCHRGILAERLQAMGFEVVDVARLG
jgi:uncharacterized protein (DUF488 family)